MLNPISFPYTPPSQQINGINIQKNWSTLSNRCGLSEFETEAYFVLGLMHRYVLSANAILKEMKHSGFLSAYECMSSAIDVLGRCIHPCDKVRQDPIHKNRERLEEGFKYTLSPRDLISTNHGSYNINDLIELRNFSTHGACIVASGRTINNDIELLHEFRRLLFGTPVGEQDGAGQQGPIEGALDRYFKELILGDTDKCNYLVSAAITPYPLTFQGGYWPFAEQLVQEMQKEIQDNYTQGRLPISGSHKKKQDYFQLYP